MSGKENQTRFQRYYNSEQRVEARDEHTTKGEWCMATINRIHRHGLPHIATYEVFFDNREFGRGGRSIVQAKNIRAPMRKRTSDSGILARGGVLAKAGATTPLEDDSGRSVTNSWDEDVVVIPTSKLGYWSEKTIDAIEKVSPCFVAIFDALDKARDFMDKFYNKDMLYMIVGLLVVFFGNSLEYCVVFYIALQSDHDSGMKMLQRSWRRICKEMNKAYTSQRQCVRNVLDKDGDGEVSVAEVLNFCFAFMKGNRQQKDELYAIASNCVEQVSPDEIQKALKGFFNVAFHVLAILLSKVARQCTVAVALGLFVANELGTTPVSDKLKDWMPKGFKQWSVSMLNLICCTVCVFLALVSPAHIFCLYTSCEGANVFLTHLLEHLKSQSEGEAGAEKTLGTAKAGSTSPQSLTEVVDDVVEEVVVGIFEGTMKAMLDLISQFFFDRTVEVIALIGYSCQVWYGITYYGWAWPVTAPLMAPLILVEKMFSFVRSWVI